jgi:DNA repair protein RadD
MTLTPAEVAAFFTDTRVNIENNPRLREPQVEGHAAAFAHFSADGGQALEQIPVGCGKSGLITLLPFGIANGRVLVIAPNLTIRDQLVDAFSSTSPKCFYRAAAVLTDLSAGPYVAALDADANLSDLDEAHVAVTNIQQLSAGGGRWLNNLPEDYFDLILVDEGHHSAATSWQEVFERFPAAKILSLTATPFRGDDQPVEGEPIYSYPIAEGMRRGYISQIQASNVAPTELRFTYRGQESTHTLEEVLRLKERDWFSRGVALAEQCNVSIVDGSIEWLKHVRETGNVHHQIIAVACSVDHARAIRRLYEERGYAAHEIHSQMRPDEQVRVHRDLRDGTLDVIVQVQMLGEGFDHPPLSIAAIFRPFRSLSPYIQFVGRVMRVNVQQAPGHLDNRGIVVSHVGLNLDRHWEDFKSLDTADQQLVQTWLLSGVQAPPAPVEGDRPPLRPAMLVSHELTLDQFLGEKFLEISDADLPDRIMEVLRAQGIDPAAAGLNREVLDALREADALVEPVGPVAQPVQPQAHRQRQRARLNDQIKTVSVRICQATKLSLGGRKLVAKGVGGATSDLTAVIILMNNAVNAHLGHAARSRRELSTAEIELAIGALDQIADGVQADVLARIS